MCNAICYLLFLCNLIVALNFRNKYILLINKYLLIITYSKFFFYIYIKFIHENIKKKINVHTKNISNRIKDNNFY